MAENDNSEYIVPVVSEELHADAVPVETGGVRVVKRVQTHDEVLEQELRKGRAEIKRVKTDRVVDGPQAPRQAGNTLIIPVVSEVLQVQKTWVVTEEIHVTQTEERETVQQTVPVSREVAEIERVDETGRIVDSRAEDRVVEDYTRAAAAAAPVTTTTPSKRRLAQTEQGRLSRIPSIVKPANRE